MAAGYSIFANGGRKVKPTLVDRIQDRYGKTIFQHDDRECRGCNAPAWTNQTEPSLVDRRPIVLDPLTAYQVTHMLEGVVQRGTGTALRELGRPIAGKTGTTNEEKDVWFIGYTPEMVVAVYIGYDKPRTLGTRVTGGTQAAPIVRDFFKLALADRAAQPFRVPAGIKLIRINMRTGTRAQPGDEKVILEAFKPGTAPGDAVTTVGFTDERGNPLPDPDRRPWGTITPEADRAIGRGPFGLW
jgi:penicillin-binding protein 1A